jgi:hypothetical protein
MTICPSCGAESADGDFCPRCGAKLPADRSSGLLALASGIIGAVCAVGAAVGLIVDFVLNHGFPWSLVCLASSALAWLLVGFPLLYPRRPTLFLAVMCGSSVAYLWALERLLGGHWFLGLGLPIALAAMASASLTVFLCLRARRRGPNIAAFVLLGGTLICLAVENILSLYFSGAFSFTWSAIVAASALPTAALLLGIQNRLRQARWS